MNEIISFLNALDAEVASSIVFCAFFVAIGILVALVLCFCIIGSIFETKYDTQIILAGKEKKR
ncbi:MAG: hypothetical protein IJA29_00275 [Lachnospiraceae bacterium]|nr:hypothetical protein [Lachnospiraceae bacterium]